MDVIEIIGGKPLKGKVRISGSKNAALPILASTLLTNSKVRLTNIPDLSDIFSMIELLKSLNVKIYKKNNYYTFKSDTPKSLIAPYELVRKMRASFLIIGPLLSRYGYAKVSLPGGCAIGTRPVDLHLDGLKKMGASFSIKNGYVHGSVKGKLKGTSINFKKKSVGATENLIMAATLAEGKTIIHNAAQEPEIDDLCNFLIQIGAKIKGHGTDLVTIDGVNELNGGEFEVMPDRIEAGTFALSVLGCSGDLILTGVNNQIYKHLKDIFKPIKFLKLKIIDDKSFSVVKVKDGELNLKVTTKEYPGFPTDLQAQLTAALLKIQGLNEINEKIFENRFMHVGELRRMGAKIRKKGSKVEITGVKEIYGAELMATDLRASSCLIIAGLMAKGKTIINRVYHLDRGYENIEEKLKACGAKIDRIKK